MSKATRKTTRLAQLALLIALLVVLEITPLGFINVPPVSITTMHLPVIVGAVLFGPLAGAILGGAFGMLSMIHAIQMPLPPITMLFSPFTSGEPLQSIFLCFVPRILLGVIAALLYRLFRALIKKEGLAIGLAAGLATVCHTFMVLGTLSVFFKALPLKEVFLVIVSVNGVSEAVAAVLIGVLVCRPLLKAMQSRI